MGNGAGSRYQKSDEPNYDTWRKPKIKNKKGKLASDKENKSAPPVIPVTSIVEWRATSGAAAAIVGTGASPSSPGIAVSKGASVAVRGEGAKAHADCGLDDDDEDLAGFANLANAASQAWDDLMVKNRKQDLKGLVYLGELKESIERAAKRAEALRREVATAALKVETHQTALDDLCRRLEQRGGTPGSGTSGWKLGDILIRNVKGFCELCMIHHDSDPPFFEVRMSLTKDVVGTEAHNLVPLTPPQQGLARTAIQKYDKAKAELVLAEAAATQSVEELKQQHHELADQVETKLKSPVSSAPSNGNNRSAPSMMPDLNLMMKWSQNGPKKEKPPSGPSYPEVRGVREDFRLSGKPEASPATFAEQANIPAARSAQTGFAPNHTPSGFPSLSELNRLEEQAAAARQRQADQQQSYPGVNSGAAREVFSRPEPSSYRRPSKDEASLFPQDMGGQAPPTASPVGLPPLNPDKRTSGTRLHNPGSQFQAQAENQARAQAQAEASRQGQAQARADADALRQQAQAEAQAQREAETHGQSQPQAHAWSQHSRTQQHLQTDWVAYKTQDGQCYFHNERTNETAWSLPVGARARDGMAQSQGGQGFYGQQQYQQQQETPVSEDPWVGLRQQEEEYRKQREQWAQWYAQYNSWYQQQAAAAAFGANARSHTPGGHSNTGSRPAAAGTPGAATSVPPRGPRPPKLDADIEDHAIYAIKSSVLREMELMVEAQEPLAKRKKALRVLQIQWHPDKNMDRTEAAVKVFQFIEETKDWFLYDPEGKDADACD